MTDGHRRAPFASLYPILDAATAELDVLVADAAALARAGCRLIQLRAKELGGRAFHDWTVRCAAAAREASASARILVNDRVDVALLAEADGVHLGQDDVEPEAARRLLGDDAIIGLSTHDIAQATEADRAPVDYVAIGPVFSTASKSNHEAPLGIEGVREVRAVVTKPLVAIGGITLESAPALLGAGVDGLAVISALRAFDIGAVAGRWLACEPKPNA